MAGFPFAFTPAERAAIAAILDTCPEAAVALAGSLAPAVEDLVHTCRGLVTLSQAPTISWDAWASRS